MPSEMLLEKKSKVKKKIQDKKSISVEAEGK
jgi:hypothetical protein